jgi:hypothetical protein
MRTRAPQRTRAGRARAGRLLTAGLTLALLLAGCGGGTRLLRGSATTATRTVTVGVVGATPGAATKLGFPDVATKNTTRVAGTDPTADAAGVALAVYPSHGAGTHPAAVTVAPTDDWEAAIASSVLMAAPVKAPVLLSGADSLPAATRDALAALAPTGSGRAGGAQVIRVGAVGSVASSLKSTAIGGRSPYALAAAIDRFQTAAAGQASADVVVASTSDPAYAMPAAGWAAESGDPVLFVSPTTVPAATRQALQSHNHPHIYVLGPPSAVSPAVARQLGRYGTVKRVGAGNPVANSVAFAVYRDPACPVNAPCAHVPGSFGWAMRSPGHGYTLLDASRPLDAAASAPLSASGDFGPQLLVNDPTTLPKAVLHFFLDYATPGYTQEGPTAAVYNHGWIIGDQSAVSTAVQSQTDKLLQAIPATTK